MVRNDYKARPTPIDDPGNIAHVLCALHRVCLFGVDFLTE